MKGNPKAIEMMNSAYDLAVKLKSEKAQLKLLHLMGVYYINEKDITTGNRYIVMN
jgi:hypothetical protein